MRAQLIQYVHLLFAGAPDSEEMKQEILQNTLDRYDDLVSQGKSPEAAYRLAISGIGDINEILGSSSLEAASQYTIRSSNPTSKEASDTPAKKVMRAIAVALYIICMLPLIVLGDMGMDNLGFCGTLSIVAVATVLIMLGKKQNPRKEAYETAEPATNPKLELRKGINSLIWAIGLALYFILSFATQAWYITWVLFPIIASVQGLVKACMDLKEANRYEN